MHFFAKFNSINSIDKYNIYYTLMIYVRYKIVYLYEQLYEADIVSESTQCCWN